MGDQYSWHVYRIPNKGQIFNVSAFVLPRRAGMPEDGQTSPMFPDEDPPQSASVPELLEVVREQARALSETSSLLHEMFKDWRRRNGKQASREREVTTRHRPQDARFRTYEGFHAAMCEYEQAVLKQGHKRCTRDLIGAAAGGPSTKSIRRIMVETYGMSGDEWPPSSWPEHLAQSIKDKITEHSHQLALGVAAVLSFYIMLDAGLDNQPDGTLRVCLDAIAHALHLIHHHQF
jgi:hypothetical protein